MLFNSFEFLLFLPLSFIIFSYVKNKKIVILVLSYLFYMYWNPIYILLILSSTIVDFNIAKKIDLNSVYIKKKLWLSLSIFLNLSLLFIFKYYNFFVATTGNTNLIIDVLLPVGISFYTFQTIGYSIDVFRGVLRPEKSFLNFSLFVCYFPQLVAGPIEKASRLLPKIRCMNNNVLVIDSFVVEKVLVGLFKKIIIADRIAIYINHIYSAETTSSLDIILVFYLFAIQIYCDFSGYCDIAIGISRAFGIKLTENFKQPYFSCSIKEFWGRWHITLSIWFRDYLYIPLGGKYGVLKGAVNLMIVFLVSGLWHGANWTFVFWGGLHGAFLIMEKYLVPIFKTVVWVKVIMTFHLVSFAWLFFRSSNLVQAFSMIESFLRFDFSSLNLGGSSIELFFGLACFSILIVYDYCLYFKVRLLDEFRAGCFNNYWFRFASAGFFLVFGVFSQTEFLYFQF